jgi:hypothetical protein
MASVVHEISIDDSDRGKPSYALGKNLSQCQFLHFKCNMDWPVSNRVLHSDSPVANGLRYEI